MANHEHIDNILHEWKYDPNRLNVRVVKGDDGRKVLQMRIDMGVLQLEMSGRPDGARPEGQETYLDLLNRLTFHRGEEFVMDEDQCYEVDREFVQFYHRRICWLQLSEYEKAVRDAQHTLGLMDFCRDHSPDEQWTLSHEQYRPFVMFHRIQAAALAKVDDGGPESAIEQINDGLAELSEVFAEFDSDGDHNDNELVQRLTELREELRRKFEIGKTLKERLDDAVVSEKYELAARLRDEISRRRSGTT